MSISSKKKVRKKIKRAKFPETKARQCNYCKKPLIRFDGEGEKSFEVREFCNDICSDKYARHEHRVESRTCVRCNETIPRVAKNGVKESYTNYMKRKYCSYKCEHSAAREENEGRNHRIVEASQFGGFEQDDRVTVDVDVPRNKLPAPRGSVPAMGAVDSVPHVRKLARAYTVEAINGLVEAVRSNNLSAKVTAAKELIDRGWGRAMQQHTVLTRRIDEMDAHELMELLGMREDENGRIIEVTDSEVVPHSNKLPPPQG